jgi:hypothetical protein
MLHAAVISKAYQWLKTYSKSCIFVLKTFYCATGLSILNHSAK